MGTTARASVFTGHVHVVWCHIHTYTHFNYTTAAHQTLDTCFVNFTLKDSWGNLKKKKKKGDITCAISYISSRRTARHLTLFSFHKGYLRGNESRHRLSAPLTLLISPLFMWPGWINSLLPQHGLVRCSLAATKFAQHRLMAVPQMHSDCCFVPFIWYEVKIQSRK